MFFPADLEYAQLSKAMFLILLRIAIKLNFFGIKALSLQHQSKYKLPVHLWKNILFYMLKRLKLFLPFKKKKV